jgi:uncharacterized protein
MSALIAQIMGSVTGLQYLAVALTAVVASIIGGVAGYGTGLLMPLVLVPIIGAEAVVPVIGLSALFTNSSRLAAFWSSFDARKAVIIGVVSIPTCIIGSYGYTRLTGPNAAIWIGAVLIALVPLRRILKRQFGALSERGMAAAGVGYGLLVGGTAGSGVVLLSILMAAGLEGAAVVATDAGVSLIVGVVKTAVFRTAGALPWSSVVMAVLIGVCAIPGAFIAKRLTRSLSLSAHTSILDGVVVLGGTMLIVQALRH